MDPKAIIEARKTAEKSVEGMADPSLKVKAFEQIFAKLLAAIDRDEPTVSGGARRPTRRRPQIPGSARHPSTLSGRVLVLRDDGFFGTQRSLSNIREELASRGFHYPLTTLSGAMQKLVRDRDLRRQRVASGKKKSFKYTNA